MRVTAVSFFGVFILMLVFVLILVFVMIIVVLVMIIVVSSVTFMTVSMKGHAVDVLNFSSRESNVTPVAGFG